MTYGAQAYFFITFMFSWSLLSHVLFFTFDHHGLLCHLKMSWFFMFPVFWTWIATWFSFIWKQSSAYVVFWCKSYAVLEEPACTVNGWHLDDATFASAYYRFPCQVVLRYSDRKGVRSRTDELWHDWHLENSWFHTLRIILYFPECSASRLEVDDLMIGWWGLEGEYMCVQSHIHDHDLLLSREKLYWDLETALQRSYYIIESNGWK